MLPRWPALLLLAAIAMQIGKAISSLDALATPAGVTFFLAFAAYGVGLLVVRDEAQQPMLAPGTPITTASHN